MPEMISIPVDQIIVPDDYIRPLDEIAADRLARQIEAEGQRTPIAVYRSNAGERPYTLIYGARRRRAMELLGRREITAYLRFRDEAPMLAFADNFSAASLNTLEQGEHIAAYVEWWVSINGPVTRGGDRRAKFHGETLLGKSDYSDFPFIYNDLIEKFHLSKATIWRLLSIGRMDIRIRNAARRSQYADDFAKLFKLAKLPPSDQARLGGALEHEPDLETALRIVHGDKNPFVNNRAKTGDWRMEQLLDAWDHMPADYRERALEKIGAMKKPLDPWPQHLPKPSANIRSARSSLVAATLDLMSVASPMSYVAIEAAKVQYAPVEWQADHTAGLINAHEAEQRPEYERQKAKALASKSRKPKRGRPADPLDVKRKKLFQKLFTADLADQLLATDISIGHPTIGYLKSCDADDQFAVACHLGNEHSYQLEEVIWRVERSRMERASSPAYVRSDDDDDFGSSGLN